MAIVTDWAKPLEDALFTKLDTEELKAEKVSDLEKAAGMLYGENPPVLLKEKLEKKKLELNDRYEKALKKTEKGKTTNTVQKGITELDKLGNFRDALRKTEEAKARLKWLEKRDTVLRISAVAVLTLFLIGTAVIHKMNTEKLRKRIEQITVQAQSGETEQALAAVEDLLGNGGLQSPEYSLLHPAVEAILEQTALDEGFAAAYARYQEMKESMPSALDKDLFWEYGVSTLKNEEVSGAERWSALGIMMEWGETEYRRLQHNTQKAAENAEDPWGEEYGFRNFTQADATNLSGAYLDQLSEELETGSVTNAQRLIDTQSDVLLSIKADPNAALRFLYALNGAGYDVFEIFPDGIPLNLPVAYRVNSLLLDHKNDPDENVSDESNSEGADPAETNSEESDPYMSDSDEIVDMSTVLPILIEEPSIYRSQEICKYTGSSEERMHASIAEIKNDDSYYNVRLLTEFLFRLPEEMLPDTFDECGSLLCMQESYYNTGSIIHTSNSSGLKSTEFYPCFSALDLVTVYDLKNPDLGIIFYSESHPARVEDDVWFTLHKSTNEVLSKTNLLGQFDMESLKEEYVSSVDRIGLLRFYWLFDSVDTGEEETNGDAE